MNDDDQIDVTQPVGSVEDTKTEDELSVAALSDETGDEAASAEAVQEGEGVVSADPNAPLPSQAEGAEFEEKPAEEQEVEAAEGESPEEELEDEVEETEDDGSRWYVVHTYSGHENKVATNLKQKVASEHLEAFIKDVLVPTQDKIEVRSGKKETVKEKIFPGYILVKMVLSDNSWLAVRTTPGVTAFVGMGNKPTPIPDSEVKTIVRFMTQGAISPTFKEVFSVDDPVKIIDGPFAQFVGKVDMVDKDHGKVRVLVSIFGRETPVELDFLQVQRL